MNQNKHLLARLWIYQKERFPIFAHGLLIASFTFSAMAFSSICREDDNVFSVSSFFKAFVNTFFIFLLLRISDEFKDKDYDRTNRPYLPVPRGLISLSELKTIGLIVFTFLIAFNLLFALPQILLFSAVLIYMFFMFNEFFVGHWLVNRPLWYVTSHMMIIPLIDTLASSFDWMGKDSDFTGLMWFFAVSFFNGCTLELGRKIKSTENEESNSYSTSLGFDKSLTVFQIILGITFILCIGASVYSNLSVIHHFIFIILYLLCAGFGIWFRKNRTAKNAKLFETFSGIWAVLMYLNLGLGLYF